METLESLGHRMQSVQDLESVVRTMKGLAAANIRQYEQAVEAIRDYDRTVEFGMQIVMHRQKELRTRSLTESGGPLAVIILGSDQGMCGPFNSRIVNHALSTISDANEQLAAERLLAVGVRVGAELDTAGHTPVHLLHLPSSVSEISRCVQDLLLHVDAWRNQRGVRRVWLFHQRPLSGASYEAKRYWLMPLDVNWLRELREQPWPNRMLPTYSMDWQDLFSSLVRQYLFVRLYRAMAESMAAENTARLASMQAAQKNVEEQLDELQARYHRQRQSAITEELLDVMAGFEALSSS